MKLAQLVRLVDMARESSAEQHDALREVMVKQRVGSRTISPVVLRNAAILLEAINAACLVDGEFELADETQQLLDYLEQTKELASLWE